MAAPRNRAAAHLLAPGVERRAGLQPSAVRTDPHRLVRIAAPRHRLCDLRPKPQQQGRRCPTERDAEHAAGDIAVSRGLVVDRREAVGLERAVGLGPVDPTRQVAQLHRRRGLPERCDVVESAQRKAGGAHQCEQFVSDPAQPAVEALLVAELVQQLVLRGPHLDAVMNDFGLFEHADLPGQHLRDQFTGLTDLVGDETGRGVVARDHAPEAALAHDRHRHRSVDRHVDHVFDVDRRDAAQHRIAQIDRPAGHRIAVRQQRRRPIADIRNDPDGVAGVQRTRLRRNIRGRKVEIQQRWNAVDAIFGDHLSAPIGRKSIDLDAVETGDPAHLAGRDVAGHQHAGRLLQPPDRSANASEEFAGRFGGVARLQLQDAETIVTMQNAVEGPRTRAGQEFDVKSDSPRRGRRTAHFGAG